MNKIFNNLNNNLFKIGDNYVCINNEGIKKGDWVLEILNKVIFRAINEGNDYNNYSFKKVAFSTQFIHESIPVLDINTTDNIEELSLYIKSLQQPKEIQSIEVEYEEYTEENTGNELKWINTRPVTLPNGKIKCKINYIL